MQGAKNAKVTKIEQVFFCVLCASLRLCVKLACDTILFVHNRNMTVEIEGVTLHLAHPDELSIRWVGQEELMRQLLAAWLVVHEQDMPMNPRLLGKPGVGKTTLAYAAGRRMGRDVYILQATMDTRPEDLLVTPVIEAAGQLRYVASPLVTAMIRGGIAILDEGNR